MNIILGCFTGSRVYGDPPSDSDVDLVLLVDDLGMELLMQAARDDGRQMVLKRHHEDYPESCIQFRFGLINIIATTDPVWFGTWKKVTDELEREGVVISREAAVRAFKKEWEKRGLIEKRGQAEGDRVRGKGLRRQGQGLSRTRPTDPEADEPDYRDRGGEGSRRSR